MASLRARLLAAVLVLAAGALLLVGGIVYAEQRSFLYERVDEQARSAPPAAAHALAEAGIGPAIDPDHDHRGGRGGGDRPPPDGGDRVLPQGTYVERRSASGRVLGHRIIAFGQDINADPALPKNVPPGRLMTVNGKRGDENRYRVYADADPSGFGTTIVAIPLTEVDQTLRRLLAVLALVILGVLVEDLLTLARLDEIADAPHTAVDLGRLVGDAADDARATAPDREIASAVEGETTVLGDAHQLRQVLANLMRNALVHTPAGTPIELRAARDDGEVRIEVRDHGPGLPTANPAELFERFWRSEGGRKQGRAGAGLGLAIVAGIVDAHHGRVEARNAPDGGASFVVHLPAA